MIKIINALQCYIVVLSNWPAGQMHIHDIENSGSTRFLHAIVQETVDKEVIRSLGAEASECRGCRHYGKRTHKNTDTMEQETLLF